MSVKPSVFISYNHGSHGIVEELADRLNVIADVYWDERLGHWESLGDFMDGIQSKDFAVLIISDAYLESEACMREAVRLMDSADWDKKALFVVEQDARSIYSALGRAERIDYWETKERELHNALGLHATAAAAGIMGELELVQSIKSSLGVFLERVADARNPDTTEAIDAICRRIQISARRSSAQDLREEIVTLVSERDMTARDIAVATNRNIRTIQRYLGVLLDEGIVGVRGGGKIRIYHAC